MAAGICPPAQPPLVLPVSPLTYVPDRYCVMRRWPIPAAWKCAGTGVAGDDDGYPYSYAYSCALAPAPAGVYEGGKGGEAGGGGRGCGWCRCACVGVGARAGWVPSSPPPRQKSGRRLCGPYAHGSMPSEPIPAMPMPLPAAEPCVCPP